MRRCRESVVLRSRKFFGRIYELGLTATSIDILHSHTASEAHQNPIITNRTTLFVKAAAPPCPPHGRIATRGSNPIQVFGHLYTGTSYKDVDACKRAMHCQ